MARIPDNFIQDLLARTDLVELVDARVPLKKAGRNYSACCPFHNEKTPSFSVAPDKQFYYCFGCGANGNAIGFLMEYERLSFPEAVEQLAARAGMEVPKEEGPRADQSRRQKDRLQSLYDLLARAERFYRHQLRHASERQSAVGYLKGRGLTGDVAARYGLGFAPPGFDTLTSGLSLDNAGVELALTAGLLVRREDTGRTYDKFRDRVMFPIRDSRGRTIGFGGRVLGDGKPKYLNSPETPVFHKGRELYGLWEWRQSRDRQSRLFVVEGYMDVIALAQHGIPNAVATLGTATTEEHAEKLFRQVDEVVFCFDGDNAGRRAAWRALESTLPALEDGKQARFLFLPEGEDPDTLVREQGREEFLRLADQSPTLSGYLFDHLGEGLDLRSVDGRARLARLAMPLIGQAKGELYRRLLRRELAGLTRLEEDELATLATPAPRQRAPAPAAEERHADTRERGRMPAPPADDAPPSWDEYDSPGTTARDSSRARFSLVERLILILVSHPQVLESAQLPDGVEELDEPHLDNLVEIVALLSTEPDQPRARLLGRVAAMEKGELVAEIIRGSEPVQRDADLARQEWRDGVSALEVRYLLQAHERENRAPTPDVRRLSELNRRLADARNRQRGATSEGDPGTPPGP